MVLGSKKGRKRVLADHGPNNTLFSWHRYLLSPTQLLRGSSSFLLLFFLDAIVDFAAMNWNFFGGIDPYSNTTLVFADIHNGNRDVAVNHNFLILVATEH